MRYNVNTYIILNDVSMYGRKENIVIQTARYCKKLELKKRSTNKRNVWLLLLPDSQFLFSGLSFVFLPFQFLISRMRFAGFRWAVCQSRGPQHRAPSEHSDRQPMNAFCVYSFLSNNWQSITVIGRFLRSHLHNNYCKCNNFYRTNSSHYGYIWIVYFLRVLASHFHCMRRSRIIHYNFAYQNSKNA